MNIIRSVIIQPLVANKVHLLPLPFTHIRYKVATLRFKPYSKSLSLKTTIK